MSGIKLLFLICVCVIEINAGLQGLKISELARKHEESMVKSNKCEDGECVPLVKCPAHVKNPSPVTCHVNGERVGVCCSTGQNHTGVFHKKARSHFVTVSLDDIISAARSSQLEISKLLDREQHLLKLGRNARVPEGSASYTHFRNSRFQNNNEMNKIMGLSTKAIEMVAASRAIKNKARFSNEQYEYDMIESNLLGSPLGHNCLPTPHCPADPTRYTSLDGTCNNPLFSEWGSTLTPYSRLLPPHYDDGVWSPRRSVYGHHLPSPRSVSSEVFWDVDQPDSVHTLMLMTFGQFLSHDFTRAIENKYPNGSGIQCCTPDNRQPLPPDWSHYSCYPILVSPQDPFYKRFGVGCINFVRSILAPRDDCNLGYAQQMNKVSHYIDGSVIYGTDHEILSGLREFYGGRLKMFRDYGRDLLPLNNDRDACLSHEHGSACFHAGDGRSNQMVSLIAVHTLFAREHNRIAHELFLINPHWSDETLFLEARRIVVAELQHITYSQWLPEIIGYEAMDEFHLNVDFPGYSNYYDPHVNPSVINEFATAAFRFGHSMVDGKMKIYGKTKMEEIIDIPDIMFSPSKMRKVEFFDELLTTLTFDCVQKVDTSVTDALTKYLFRAGNPFGLDLISLNIQRGRDHGFKSYNDYRELVGLKRYHEFEDFGSEIGMVLKNLYDSPDDVDLFVGGLIEPVVPGGIVGYTFREIIAEQFSRFKKGDRYFYNLNPDINPGHFTKTQLKEIKKSSLSRIICDNSDGVLLANQALNAFRKPGIDGNSLVSCKGNEIPRINLMAWKDAVSTY